ncbi:hypothetical protein HK097_007736 [Rhizophlyctis rosea]|uniref:Major facilitator superfamily (MFS) profile domain-containing protein n=1 Tax=Rhizophlyctis rosea TaxID=64517 RepID=A0AAD5SD69_9FUNG|nr:hypothetical protein HK097_007736 [Rhizophlyctis rosea]
MSSQDTYRVEDEEKLGGHQHTQEGVAKVEGVYQTVTKAQFIAIYVGLLIVSYVWSLDSNTNWVLTPFVASEFAQHSLIYTVGIIDNLVSSIVKIPLAKLSDVFGRAETYLVSLIIYEIGFILMTFATKSVQQYAAASILYTVGAQGIYLMQQIIIADLTSLSNRGFLSSLPDAPFYINNWVAPLFAQQFVPDRWRIAFAIIIVLMPIASSFVIGFLWFLQRKAARLGKTIARSSSVEDRKFKHNLFWEMDIVGIIILAGAWSLILYCLYYNSSFVGGWKNGAVIAMIVVGIVIHIGFFVYEFKFAKAPIFPPIMMANRTVLGGVLATFFVWMSWYSYTAYFTSYLYLARMLTPAQAQWVSNTWSFASITSSILGGLAMKFVKRHLPFSWLGFVLAVVGNGLLVNLRTLTTPIGYMIGAQILTGFGAGLITMATQVAVQAALPRQNVGMVTALFLAIASFGGAIGSIIAGQMWAQLLPGKLLEFGVPIADIPTILGSLVAAASSPHLPLIQEAYTDVSKKINIAGVCVLIPIAVCLAIQKNLYLSDEEAELAPDVKEVKNKETVERS